MLHGYAQNAVVFYKRLGAIRRACGKTIDFVFVDAPLVLQPADLAIFDSKALNAEEATPQSKSPEDTPRGWWKADPDRSKAVGLEESLLALKDVLMKDTYDGVFGFSQGAGMAALLSALLERPDYYPPFLVDGKAPHPPMKFCVAVAGFKLLAEDWAPLFSPSYQTPTLHIVGMNDVIVVPERAQALIDVSANARVAKHDGGHFIPTKQAWRNFLRDYLRDPFGNVQNPPGPGDAAADESAAVTPIPSFPASGRVSPTDKSTQPIKSDVPPVLTGQTLDPTETST